METQELGARERGAEVRRGPREQGGGGGVETGFPVHESAVDVEGEEGEGGEGGRGGGGHGGGGGSGSGDGW